LNSHRPAHKNKRPEPSPCRHIRTIRLIAFCLIAFLLWYDIARSNASPSAKNKGQEEQNDKNEKQDLGHIGSARGDAEKSEYPGHKGDYQEN
jgi:hypothetical protein